MKDDDTPDNKAPARIDTLEPEEATPAEQPATDGDPPAGEMPVATVTDEAAAVPSPDPVQGPPEVRRRGGFLPALLGGALAAIGGFALSHYNLLDLRQDTDPAAVEARFQALEAQLNEGLAGTRSEIAASAGRADAAAAAANRAAEAAAPAEAGLSALSSRLDALDKALAAASSATEGGASAAAVAALASEVEALKARPQSGDPAETRAIVQDALKAWEADASARAEAEAETAKQNALAEAARQALAQAVETGAPYRNALTAIGAGDVPEALEKFADTGLPTLAGLQDSFADAARTALSDSLRAGESGDDSVWSFLRVQTGARSLSPQEGTDPDAILSRAEAALKAGDLDLALSEIEGLPPAGRAAMADWTAAAGIRADAAKALAPLMAAPPISAP